jgi:hypothetical protein
MNRLAAVAAVVLSACTSLGPLPATTGVSAIPTERPGVELQTGIVPGTWLSDAAHDTDGTQSAGTQQTSALVEPDRLLGTHGLIAGVRKFGETGDAVVEPMIGLRRRLDDTFAIAGIAYGGHAEGESNKASYSATRLGGELAADATVVQTPGRWLGLHVQGSVSATYLDARGSYCTLADGQARDCDDDAPNTTGTIRGIYTAATAGATLDIGRRLTGSLHHIRLGLLGAVGGMPRIRGGVQERSQDHYRSIGLTLSFGFGADH